MLKIKNKFGKAGKNGENHKMILPKSFKLDEKFKAILYISLFKSFLEEKKFNRFSLNK